MKYTCIESIDDPRLAPYRDLKGNLFNRSNHCFVTEGDALVRRLIASPLTVHSLLVEDRLVKQYADLIVNRKDTNTKPALIFSAPASLISNIVGYDFHRGVLAQGDRPNTDFNPSDNVWANVKRIIACPLIHDQENLGLIIRTAAGLGADALLVGQKGADPFGRRPLRVSMGAGFELPILISTNFAADLKTLQDDHALPLIATTLDARAADLSTFTAPPGFVLLAGSEPTGLPDEIESMCDHHITMPMHRDIDSLNVAIATGIVYYHLTATMK